MSHDGALLREVADSSNSIADYLTTVGLEDLREDEIVTVLATAVQREPKVVDDLMAEMAIPEQALDRAVGRLVSNGYLEFRDDPKAPGLKLFALTERGLATYDVIMKAVSIKRWANFSFRQGDIVVSALPKSGTTWLQMICALLIFQTADLPAPLQELSPWMESIRTTATSVYAQLDAQEHRRFIKTHLLPGEMPVDPRATYIVVARHPLDVWVSAFAQSSPRSTPPRREALLDFISGDADIGIERRLGLISLRSLLRRLSCAWEYRDVPNVVFVRYEDLLRDLERQMRRIASQLSITAPEVTWPGLVKAATFQQMRAVADRLQPLPWLKDQPEQFFRSGRSGAGRKLLTGGDLDHYRERALQLAPPDLLAWLHG